MHNIRSFIDPQANLNDWELPDRILKGLYLGSHMAALNLTALKERNITHVLTVGTGLEQPHVDAVKYKLIEAWDVDSQDLYQHFEECVEFIKEGRESGGVVVHW